MFQGFGSPNIYFMTRPLLRHETFLPQLIELHDLATVCKGGRDRILALFVRLYPVAKRWCILDRCG